MRDRYLTVMSADLSAVLHLVPLGLDGPTVMSRVPAEGTDRPRRRAAEPGKPLTERGGGDVDTTTAQGGAQRHDPRQVQILYRAADSRAEPVTTSCPGCS